MHNSLYHDPARHVPPFLSTSLEGKKASPQKHFILTPTFSFWPVVDPILWPWQWLVTVQIQRLEFCSEPSGILFSAPFLESCGCERLPTALQVGESSPGRVKKPENTAYLWQIIFLFVMTRPVKDSGGGAASIEEQRGAHPLSATHWSVLAHYGCQRPCG